VRALVGVAVAVGAAAAPPQAGAQDGAASAPGAEFRLRIAGQSGTAQIRSVVPLPFCLDLKAAAGDGGVRTIEIHRLPDPTDPEDRGRLLYRYTAEFTAGKRQRLTGFLPIVSRDRERLEARWIAEGETLYTSRTDAKFHLDNEPAVWVAADGPKRARLYHSIPKATKQWLASPMELSAMPPSWLSLQGASCLVLDRLSSADAASAEAWRPALRQWVEGGGTLVLTANTELTTLRTLVRGILPVMPSDAPLQSLAPDPVVAALGVPPGQPRERFRTAQPAAAAVVIAEGSGLQAAYRNVGLGRVLWLGCELSEPPAASGYLGSGAVAMAMAGRRDDLRDVAILDPGDNRGWGWGGQFDDGADLDAAAESISVRAPARSGLIAGVAVWAACLAVLFALARWRGRLGAAWVVAVACGLVGFAGLTAWAKLTFAGLAAASSLTVSVGAVGAPAATSLHGTALYVPASTETTLDLGPGWTALLSPLDTRLAPALATTIEHGTGARAQLASRSTQRFRGFGRTALKGGIRLSNWREVMHRRAETVRVTNDSALPLREVVVLIPAAPPGPDATHQGFRVYTLERLEPGASALAEPGDEDALDRQARELAAASAESSESEGALRLAIAATAFARRARNQALTLHTAAIIATCDAPAAAVRIAGSAVPTQGTHLLALFAAPPIPEPVRGSLNDADVDISGSDLGGRLAQLRGRVSPAVLARLRRRRGGTNTITIRRQPERTLVPGHETDLNFYNLPPLDWNTTLTIELDPRWTLELDRTVPGNDTPSRIENLPGTFQVVELRDAYSGALIPVTVDGNRITLHHPKRFQTPDGLSLRVRFLPPELPRPTLPDGTILPLEIAGARSWSGSLQILVPTLEVTKR
jgi:hypothetical protein